MIMLSFIGKCLSLIVSIVVLTISIGIAKLHSNATTWRGQDVGEPKLWFGQLNDDNEFFQAALKQLRDDVPTFNIARRQQFGDHYSAAVVPIHDIKKYAPDAFKYYKNGQMAKEISRIIVTNSNNRSDDKINYSDDTINNNSNNNILLLNPIPVNSPRSCMLLSYSKSGDHVNFHYDSDTIGGRLISVIMLVDASNESCSHFEYIIPSDDKEEEVAVAPVKLRTTEPASSIDNGGFKQTTRTMSSSSLPLDYEEKGQQDDDATTTERRRGVIKRVNLSNLPLGTVIVYEGYTLYHRVTKQCSDQHRIVWNTTFVVGAYKPSMWNLLLNFLQDIGYVGIISYFNSYISS